MINNKQTGRIGMARAIFHFTNQGYTVSIPLNDTQYYDLIIEKDSKFQSVQCKATTTKCKTIDFRETGGTNGSCYNNSLNTKVDLIFCTDNENDWIIPRVDLIEAKVKATIRLRLEPAQNKQGFKTNRYVVL